MTEKEDQSASLCRPRFTEKGEEQELEGEKSGSKPDPITKEDHLWKLQKNDIIPGTATVALMAEFREFPWAQDTMLTVGRRDQILMGYLEKVLSIEGAVLRQWRDDQELHHRAMLSLAICETYTAEEERTGIEEYIKQREVGGRTNRLEKDMLGNSLVESTRLLSGLKQTLKKSKPKKPPTLSRGRGRRGRKPVKGRGGKGKRIKRAKKSEIPETKQHEIPVGGRRRSEERGRTTEQQKRKKP